MRIFNTYGPRMALDDGRVVSNFVTQALTGKPLTIYGDGQQTRSFQYISDLVAGVRSICPASNPHPFYKPLTMINEGALCPPTEYEALCSLKAINDLLDGAESFGHKM